MKRFRIQLVIAFIVFVCGVSLMGLVYIVFNKPEAYVNPGVVVSAPSPVATPVQQVSMDYPPKHHSIYAKPSTIPMYHATHSPMPFVSSHGLYLTSHVQAHSVGGGYVHYALTTTSHSASSSGIIYSTVSVAMPTTNFVTMASQRQVAQPEAQEAPQMAHLASINSRRAPGPPNVTPPEEHQLVEHPIGDAVWLLLLMAIGYAAYRRTKKERLA